MKQCDHFKDLILTDYIDGQMDKSAVGEIENHLAECGECSLYLKELKNNIVVPLKSAANQPIPTELWDTIKQNIENERQAKNPLGIIIDKMKEVLVFPRLVPVFASLVLMFLVGSFTINNIQIQQAKDREQGEYLVSMLSPSSSVSSESSDLGTPIERYFL